MRKHHPFNSLTKMKTKKQPVLATVLVIFGVLLIITAFFVPPLGVIDASVLTAFGEILTFAGAVIGIDYRYRNSGTPSGGLSS